MIDVAANGTVSPAQDDVLFGAVVISLEIPALIQGRLQDLKKSQPPARDIYCSATVSLTLQADLVAAMLWAVGVCWDVLLHSLLGDGVIDAAA